MIGFVIPLRTAQNEADARLLGSRIDATLQSILRQSDSRWVATLVTDNPVEFLLPDPRITVQTRSLPVLEGLSSREQVWEEDASTRRLEGVLSVVSEGLEWVMCVDADDLLHRDLVSYVHEATEEMSHQITDGYQYLMNFDRVALLRGTFAGKCGSSLIISKAMLKESFCLDEPTSADRYQFHHHAAAGRIDSGSVAVVPFPAAVYCTEHGVNLTYSTNRWRELVLTTSGIKYLANVLIRRVLWGGWSASLTEKFGNPITPSPIVRLCCRDLHGGERG